MMSADPYIQAPYFGQSFNRYSYVWNNPLSMTDPSGYTAVSMNFEINANIYTVCDDYECTNYQRHVDGDFKLTVEQFTGYESLYTNEYINGSELESHFTQNGGNSSINASGVVISNGGYTDSNGSMHVNASVSIASISSGSNTPIAPPEIISRLDQAQFAADLLATSEIPVVSQLAGVANALTYAVRGQWGMAGSSVVGLIPGFGAGADVARLGMWAAKGIGKAKSTLKTMGKTCCFVAGTLVLTSNGHANIEDLEVGDKVLAQNTATDELAYKEITKTFAEKNRPIYELTVVNTNGKTTTMETTDDHPFYVLRDKQNPFVKTHETHGALSLQTTEAEAGIWKLSKDLVAGDRIRSLTASSDAIIQDADARFKEVVVTSSTFTGKYDLTFNLTVDDFHTYFVTEQNVLVHNCEKCKGGVCGVVATAANY